MKSKGFAVYLISPKDSCDYGAILVDECRNVEVGFANALYAAGEAESILKGEEEFRPTNKIDDFKNFDITWRAAVYICEDGKIECMCYENSLLS